MKKSIFALALIFALTYLVTAPVEAPIPGPGTQVAIVPDPTSTNGGTLPSTDPAYANFTFTNLPWANVTAGNLTAYQIVVLLIDGLAPTPLLSPSQVTDLNDWVFNGGKLIIYDSEQSPGPDYSWLPYDFNTTNPGALGGFVGDVLYMEDNTLGLDDNPASTYYINTTVDYIFNDWLDAIGDANVFTTFDPNWCGDIEIVNALVATGWSHTYAEYGSGLYIYNGFDIDYLSVDTAPSANDINAVAKIWLLELKQPWGTDYNLPCERQVIEEEAVGGELLTINKVLLLARVLAPPVLIVALAVAVTVGLLYRKRLQ